MNGLDSPLEALTFIPLNLGTLISTVANNLWACLAFITATFSLWRLRTTTKTTSNLLSLPPPPPPPTPTPTPTKQTSTSSACMDIIDDECIQEGTLTRGNNKKFFSVYFKENEEDYHCDDHDETMEGGDEVEEKQSRVLMTNGQESNITTQYNTIEIGYKECRMYEILSLSLDNREVVSEILSGRDFGWYSYQNRKVIDGSVVRLWEEKRESYVGGGFPRSCRNIRTASLVLA